MIKRTIWCLGGLGRVRMPCSCFFLFIPFLFFPRGGIAGCKILAGGVFIDGMYSMYSMYAYKLGRNVRIERRNRFFGSLWAIFFVTDAKVAKEVR